MKSMPYTDYKSLALRRERGVAFVTINHPPMNMLDVPLVDELTTFLGEVGWSCLTALIRTTFFRFTTLRIWPPER